MGMKCATAWIIIGFQLLRAAETPNIVFVMADDLGWRDVGYAGAEFFETPHINRLATQGMRFEAAYSGGPNCAPTRACLMTGLYPPRHHIYQPGARAKGRTAYMKFLVPAQNRKNADLNAQAEGAFPITTSLPARFTCIPEVLKQAGYSTARIGKWHLGDEEQGFDLSTTDGKGSMRDHFYGDVDVAEQLTDRAIRFIQEHKDGPFFLYLSHWDVHTPWRARNEVVKKYQEKLESIPKAERAHFDPVYAAMIEAVDQSVGRIVAKVDELGLGSNTLIVFTSDNGGIEAVSQLAPLRGEKGSLFEGGVRIPCVMRWSGRIPAGSSCETPITSVDYLPTFAKLTGAPLPEGQPVDGTDVSPLLTGGSIPERSIFWHYPMYLSGRGLDVNMADGSTYSWRGFPSTSIRRGKYKMIEFLEDDTAALYDLSKDPGEKQDLAKEMSDVASAMRAELDAWQKATEAPIPSIPNPEYIGRAE